MLRPVADLPAGAAGLVSNFLEAEVAYFGVAGSETPPFSRSTAAMRALGQAERALLHAFPEGAFLLRGPQLVIVHSAHVSACTPHQL